MTQRTLEKNQVGSLFERFLKFTKCELQSTPGRLNMTLRCVVSSTLVVIISMALQIPWLALSLIVMFYVTQSNAALTRLTGLMFFVGSTLAIGSALLLLKFTYDQPLARILIASALVWTCMFLMRATQVGVVFFICAIVIVYVQSFVDMTDQADVVVRLTLWVWVAVNYAILVSLMINTLLLPEEPAKQLMARMHLQILDVSHQLRALQGRAEPIRICARQVQDNAVWMQKLLGYAAMRDAQYFRMQGVYQAQIATVSRLHAAASQIPVLSSERATVQVAVCIEQACALFAQALLHDRPYEPPALLSRLDDALLPGPLREMRAALLQYASTEQTVYSLAKSRKSNPIWVPDAFTNPVYRQFALKTTVATLIGYLFYVGTDWQGIHTVMLTCLIVAQSSLGATQRRIGLRVVGAAVGSLSALAAIIWIVPQLDDLAGLVLLCLPILGASAWLAAGSERISYAGIQMMFTFAMALLEHFGPTSNITEIRDRMIGICLGVALSMFIHCVWWPESEKRGLYSKWEHLLDEIVAYLRNPSTTDRLTADAPHFVDPALWSRFQACETMLERVLLEPDGATANASPKIDARAMQTAIAAARELLISSNAFFAEMHTLQACCGEESLAPCRLFLERLAIALEHYKDAFLQHADQPSSWIAALPKPLDVHQTAAIRSVSSVSTTNSLGRLQGYSNLMVAHFAQMRRVWFGGR
jgi:multidrug resistance protein MdtO